MRSGCTAPFAPTSGFSTPGTAPTSMAHAASPAASSSPATARWWRRWRRRGCAGAGAEP
jgi:hypothetical protein